MLNKIIQTFFSKIGIGGFSLLAAILISQYLGAEGKGTTSLILASITILMVFCNMVGGTVLVYLVPRNRINELFLPTVIWAVIMSFAGSLVFSFFHLVEAEYIPHIFCLTLINALASNNQMILLGKENIRATNILGITQAFLVVAVMIVSFIFLGFCTVKAYICALYVSYSAALIVSTIFIYPYISSFSPANFSASFLKMFRYGRVVQLATALALVTYRLSYYMIEHDTGKASLGVFSIGVQLSEAIWLVGGSIALTLFSKVANSEDPNDSRELTARLTRISFILTALLLLPLVLVPSWAFGFIFGKEFTQVSSVILCLSPGILFFSMNITLNHYFSGTGQYRICTISAAIGFITIIIFNSLFIPRFGILGAAGASTIAYTAMAFYQLVIFKKESGFGWNAFIFNAADLSSAIEKLKKYIS